MSATDSEHPFAVLGLAPAADAAQVKRAWFALLAKHPPHSDPQGFRRLRAAYEAVSSPAGLAQARATAAPDVAAELLRWETRFAAALAAARAAEGEGSPDAQRFVEAVSKLRLAEALAAFAPPAA